MYYWYKTTLFHDTPEEEAETISVDYIIFFHILKINPQLAWAKRPNATWKSVKDSRPHPPRTVA
jgi:hypothetical protein